MSFDDCKGHPSHRTQHIQVYFVTANTLTGREKKVREISKLFTKNAAGNRAV
jgi:hypothetical protein